LTLSRTEWLVILIAPVYAFVITIGALFGNIFVGVPGWVRPNVFIGSIAILPLVFMGLPLHSLWQSNFRTVPALAALFVGHVAYGLNICLLIGLWGSAPWPFERCISIFPALSFVLLTTAWLGSRAIRSEPAMESDKLLFLTLRALAASSFAGLVIGPLFIFIVMAGINAMRRTPA
jgi:hypothetical protein